MKIWRSKTFWTSVTGGITAIAGYLTGELSLTVCLGAVFVALGAIFMREGIEKSGNPTNMPISERGETVK